MLFQDYKPNFFTLSPSQQLKTIQEYREQRVQDLLTLPDIRISKNVKRKKTQSKASKEKKIPVSIEQLEALQRLGLI